MFSYITGILTDYTADSVVIECNGIGFLIYVPSSLIGKLPSRDSQIKLFTYLHVKEDLMQLYGFLTKEEHDIFIKMLGVSGIGPKGALSILSQLSIDALRFAIYAQDAKVIAKAPGIGLKTAQKLILELKDKIKLEEASGEIMNDTPENTSLQNEAVMALAALGYSNAEAVRAVSKIKNREDMSVEAIIKAALKQMI